MHWIALPLPQWAIDQGAVQPMTPVPLGPETAGWWALRFTPRVVLVDAESVLLEVSITERLWGGRDALLAQVCEAWMQAVDAVSAQHPLAVLGSGQSAPVPCADAVPCVYGCGPTALMAQAYLRVRLARRPLSVQGFQEGQKFPDPQTLPLHTLTALRPHVASLERMGCRTWGALQALPRAGVARRFGAAALRALDQALGSLPQAHRWIELPEQFALTVELPALAESADALLWSANRCMSVLQGWLQARQQGVLALELAWRHDLRRIDGVAIAPTQALPIRTAQATQDMSHLRRLLSENLARIPLAAPVNQITVRLLEAAPLPHRSASLLAPGEQSDPDSGQGEALHQLLERLSVRLGADHVQAPVLLADHRPECMQQWRPAAEVLLPSRSRASARTAFSTPAVKAASRPLPAKALAAASTIAGADLWPTWLLRPPRKLAVQGNRPCYHGLLRLLAGPHRFEAGWWAESVDSADNDNNPKNNNHNNQPGAGLALRDYFVAYNAVAGLVWVFRERSLAPRSATATAPVPQRWFLHGVFG